MTASVEMSGFSISRNRWRWNPGFAASPNGRLPAHKAWSDAYLAAVAGEAGLALATFDRDFRPLAVETHMLG